MKVCHLLVCLLCLISFGPANADTIISDDFTSSTVSTTTDGFRLRERSIDQGWQAARQGGGSAWTIASGNLENSSTVTGGGYPAYIPGEAPVAQTVDVGNLNITEGHNLVTLTFNYDVSDGDSLYVSLWGHTGTYDNTSGNIFANLETQHGLGNVEGSSTLDAFNLNDGATSGFGGSAGLFGEISGAASGTFSRTVDISLFAIPGVSDVNDLTAITLGFAKDEDGNPGTTSISNLELFTAVPEPSSAAFIGIAIVCFAFRRRR